jgi:hypothetical protein
MPSLLDRIKERLDFAVGMGMVETLLYELHSRDAVAQVTPGPGLSIQCLSPVSAKELLQLSGGIDSKLIEERFRSGDVCYGAYLNGRLAHYSWARRSGVQPIQEAGIEHPLSSGEFWIYHCWTEKWARGMRIYPAVMARIIQDHFENGFKTACIYTTGDNRTSQNSILRTGFRQTSTRRAFRIGRRYFPLKNTPK